MKAVPFVPAVAGGIAACSGTVWMARLPEGIAEGHAQSANAFRRKAVSARERCRLI